MEYKFAIFIGFAQSDTINVFEGYFSFNCVLGLETDEFTDQRLDKTGTFCDVVKGKVSDEENALLNHFLVVYLLD